MPASTLDLLPLPRTARSTDERLNLTRGVRRSGTESAAIAAPAHRRLEETLRRLSIDSDPTAAVDAPAVSYVQNPSFSGPQEYRLLARDNEITLAASHRDGLFFAAATLAQWLELHARLGELDAVAGLEVEDRPDFEHRGVLVDVSRNRVPTMATLRSLVDLLSCWKYNQLQLYTEHTFAYAGHEEVWNGADPITPAELRELDAYCRERCIELVPNQNSFGHFHRWLVHPRYRDLAECPAGVEHPFGPNREPFSLCPTDRRSLALLRDLYGQLLPNFTSGKFNVGLDETFDLGRGRSAGACAEKGSAAVYLEFLEAVRSLAAEHGKRIQFWADVVLAAPAVLSRLPSDATALVWGYEAEHPFAPDVAALSQAGLEVYVCPGTSSWNSFAGRADNALRNLAAAAVQGSPAARGYLVTDWGDNGHLQPPSVSLLGFLAGAAFAWNVDSARRPLEPDWERLLELHAFGGGGLGRVSLSLANAYLATGALCKNGTALFHLVASPQDRLDHTRYRGLDGSGLESVRSSMRQLEEMLSAAAAVEAGVDLIRRELAWVARALDLGARIGLDRLGAGTAMPLEKLPSTVRRNLDRAVVDLADELPELWLARSRPGGLEDSRARLEGIRLALGS